MYLHAGNNKILRSSRIIGIFDLDTSSRGEDTKNYLRAAEKNGLAEISIDVFNQKGELVLKDVTEAIVKCRVK